MPARATRSGAARVMLSPPNRTWPEVVTSPETARSVVVLPAPLPPRTATTSPSPTLSDTPCSASTGP